MSYRVEVSTVYWPDYSQEGPEFHDLPSASGFFEQVIRRPVVGLLGVRVRDTGRDAATSDPIIIAFQPGHRRA